MDNFPCFLLKKRNKTSLLRFFAPTVLRPVVNGQNHRGFDRPSGLLRTPVANPPEEGHQEQYAPPFWRPRRSRSGCRSDLERRGSLA